MQPTNAFWLGKKNYNVDCTNRLNNLITYTK